MLCTECSLSHDLPKPQCFLTACLTWPSLKWKPHLSPVSVFLRLAGGTCEQAISHSNLVGPPFTSLLLFLFQFYFWLIHKILGLQAKPWDGSVGQATQHLDYFSKFKPWNLRGGGREPTPAGCVSILLHTSGGQRATSCSPWSGLQELSSQTIRRALEKCSPHWATLPSL